MFRSDKDAVKVSKWLKSRRFISTPPDLQASRRRIRGADRGEKREVVRGRMKLIGGQTCQSPLGVEVREAVRTMRISLPPIAASRRLCLLPKNKQPQGAVLPLRVKLKRTEPGDVAAKHVVTIRDLVSPRSASGGTPSCLDFLQTVVSGHPVTHTHTPRW